MILRLGTATILSDARNARFAAIAASALIIALWLTTRRYTGIVHDSRLYTLQALAWLDPQRFGDDLFLAFGSQDRFSLFSPIYGVFLKIFGIADGNIVLLLASSMLWLAGLTALAKAWLKTWRVAIAGVTAAVILPAGIIVRVGEPFLTPRLPAEALTLIALAMMVRGRSLAASLLMALALLVHPLTALPGIAVLILYVSKDQRWIWGLVGVATAAIGIAVFVGIEPFQRLTQTFDAEWFAVVASRDNYCLIANWKLAQWLALANMLGFTAIALLFGPARNRRLLGICVSVGVGGVALAYVGGDLLHNVLLTDIQTWRWTWIVAIAGFLSIGQTVSDGFDRADAEASPAAVFPAIITLIAGIFLALSPYYSVAGLFAAPTAFLGCFTAMVIRGVRSAAIVRWASIAFILFATLLVAAFLSRPVKPPFSGSISAADVYASLVLMSVAMATLLIVSKARGAKVQRPAAALAIVLIILSAIRWDARSPWQRFVDTTTSPPATLAAVLPGHGQIYWEGDITAPWLMLQRPSYFSCEQGAGVLFSRETAINWQRRADSFRPLKLLDFERFDFCPSDEIAGTSAPRYRNDIAGVCRREAGLSALVLTRPAVDAQGRLWRSPVPFETMLTKDKTIRPYQASKFHIYDCAMLR